MRYAGAIGFAGTTETSPGIFEERITSRRYRGDVSMNAHRLTVEDTVNGQIKTGAVVSVLADEVLLDRAFDVRWVMYKGVKWQPSYIEIKHPRVVFTLGERYVDQEDA